MADVRRGKTKRKQLTKDDNSEKPTKEEYAVAKYLRFQAPCKEGKFLGNSVQYFIGSKAVDALLDSKWSAKSTKTNALFTNRVSCANYCERLLEKGFFHRVTRPEKRDKKKKPKETTSSADKGSTRDETISKRKQEKKSKKDEPGEPKNEKEAEQKEKKDKESKPGDENVDAQKEDSGQEDKKRKKKKLKLEMHDKQVFLDGSDLYVWIYDPVPVKTFIIGLFLVLGAIAVCLFPLWPPEVKLGVYYLSLAGAGFIGVILSLCILRMILFVIVWVLTLGKVTFWLLPNLTEDVGFFESFRPTYKCEFKDAAKKDDKGATDEAQKDDAASGGGGDGAENHSDGEEAGENEEQIDDGQAKEDGGSEEEEDEEEEGERVDEEEDDENEDVEHDQEENGHSASSNDNGYEIVDADDVEVLGPVDAEGSEDEEQARQRKSQKRSKKDGSPESKKTN